MSCWFDNAAWRFLERAYANKGGMVGVFLAPPSRAQADRAWDGYGIDVWERDRWGEVRWVRAFKRACYHELNWYGGVSELRHVPNTGAGTHGWHAPVRLQWETGARVMRAGWPARRWAIRMTVHPGGAAASRAAREKIPAGRRWLDLEGRPTERQSLPGDPSVWVER